jgi:hypothetical protein
MQDKEDVGPLPQGFYWLGIEQLNKWIGKSPLSNSIRLTPLPGTPSLGRLGGYLIHSDNSAQDYSASNGCIVLGRTPEIRNTIGRGNPQGTGNRQSFPGDYWLEVIQ